MNDFSELEAELKQLRPAAPSAALMEKIEHALAQAPVVTAAVLPRRRARSLPWYAFGLGLAAATALFLLARVSFEHPTAPARVVATTPLPRSVSSSALAGGFVADGITRVVYNRSDEGLVFPRDAAEPVRRVRSRNRETLHWKDPGTGASLRVSYPTEEVELIPISGQ